MVNQSEPRTRPLYIYFTFGAQAEAMHPLLYTEVGKDRLDDPQPSGIDALAASVPVGLSRTHENTDQPIGN